MVNLVGATAETREEQGEGETCLCPHTLGHRWRVRPEATGMAPSPGGKCASWCPDVGGWRTSRRNVNSLFFFRV